MPGIEVPRTEFLQRTTKRALENEITENVKRKRRRFNLMQKYHDHFAAAAETEKALFIDQHEHEVAEEVRQKEIEEDKERKKDQQRKRRREKAIADEKAKREEAMQSLADAQDDEERMRIEKDIERASKKIRDTESRLQGITPSKEPRESPQNAAKRDRDTMMDGGLMTSFHSARGEATPDGGATTKGRSRAGRGTGAARARKSKEQKQAEKDSAARAQAFIDQGQELPPLAPKEEERLRGYARDMDDDEDDDMSDMTPAFDKPTAGLTGMVSSPGTNSC